MVESKSDKWNWCLYGPVDSLSVGRFIRFTNSNSKKAGDIQYSNKQMYPLQCWNMKYVKVFDCLEEMIAAGEELGYSRDKLLSEALKNFQE